LLLLIPVINGDLSGRIGNFGVNEEVIVGEFKGGKAICPLVGFFGLVLAD
jgi:hypothetical protein